MRVFIVGAQCPKLLNLLQTIGHEIKIGHEITIVDTLPSLEEDAIILPTKASEPPEDLIMKLLTAVSKNKEEDLIKLRIHAMMDLLNNQPEPKLDVFYLKAHEAVVLDTSHIKRTNSREFYQRKHLEISNSLKKGKQKVKPKPLHKNNPSKKFGWFNNPFSR